MTIEITKVIEYDPLSSTFKWSGHIEDHKHAVIGSRYNCALTRRGMSWQLDRAIRRYVRSLRKNSQRRYVTHVDIHEKV